MTSGSAPTAIVTGARGQDGYYLVSRLLAEGSVVHATVRTGSGSVDLESVDGADRLTVHDLDIADSDGHRQLIRDVRPDEFYNLAGLSSVRQSFDDPAETWRSNADAVFGLLEAHPARAPDDAFLPILIDRHVRFVAGQGGHP